MTEIPVKRRLRNAKRRIVTTLTLSGYSLYLPENGPFHIIADGPNDSKRIRIVFGPACEDDTRPMRRAVMPENCYREIWQASDDGKTFVVGKVAGQKKK
jgi:hypothetical protein